MEKFHSQNRAKPTVCDAERTCIAQSRPTSRYIKINFHFLSDAFQLCCSNALQFCSLAQQSRSYSFTTFLVLCYLVHVNLNDKYHTLVLYWQREAASQIVFARWRQCASPSLMHDSFSTQACPPNVILIGLSVFAGSTVVTKRPTDHATSVTIGRI